MTRLTPKQEAFVDQYLISLNASEAARAAGYSKRTAYSIGEELLRKPEVANAISIGRKQRAKRTKIDADRVLIELGRIAFLDAGSAFNPDGSFKSISEMDEDTRCAIVDVSETLNKTGPTRRLKFADKLRALEMIGRHLAMFSDKVTVLGEADNPLTAILMSVQGTSLKPVRLDHEGNRS